MIEFPLYKIEKNNFAIKLYIVVVLLAIGLIIFVPELNVGYLLIAGFAFIFLSVFYDRKKKPVGELILEYHCIKLKTGKNEVLITDEHFSNIKLFYAGYKGKFGAYDQRLSGYDNHITIQDGTKYFHFQFFVASYVEEENLKELTNYWAKCDYTGENVKMLI